MNAGAAAARLVRLVPRPSGAPHVRYLLRARLRLTLWYVGVLLVLLIAIGVTMYLTLARVRRGQIDTDLRVTAPAIDRQILIRQDCSASPGGVGVTATPFDPNTFILLYDHYGPLYCNPLHLDPSPFLKDELLKPAQAGRIDIRTVTASGVPIRLLTGPLRENGQVAGTIEVGKSLRPYNQEMRSTALVLLGGSALALVLAAAGGMVVAGRALKPVQESWQRQQAFVADASHELRTPLAIVRADAEVLLRSPEQTVAANRELVEDIVHEADHLTALVGDLLLLARLDSGRLPLERGEFDARELLDEVAAQTRRLPAGRLLDVRVAAPYGLAICADRDRTLQVLRILVDNALRYTPEGGRLELRATAAGERITIGVSDSGAGISADHLPHLFDRFYRADRARGRSGGAGLGLAIARGIVEAHGGRLAIDSALGRGTTVTFDLAAA